MKKTETKKFTFSRDEVLKALIAAYPEVDAAKAYEYTMVVESSSVNFPIVRGSDLAVTFSEDKEVKHA